MKKSIIIISLFLFITLGLQVYLSSSHSTDGDTLAKIQSQTSQISSQNQILEAEILSLTSINAIQTFAVDHSMQPVTIQNLTAITVASLTK